MEWNIAERVPEAFVRVVQHYVAEKTKMHVSFHIIATELGTRPSNLSRWMAGMGPLNEEDLSRLSRTFGRSIYLTVGIINPNK